MSTALSILAFAISCACLLAAVAAWVVSLQSLIALRRHGGFTTGTSEGQRIKRRVYAAVGAWVLLILFGMIFGTLFKAV